MQKYKKDVRQQRTPKVLLADGSKGDLVNAVIGHRKKKGDTEYKIR
ncbi:TPA: hypothetical protein N0F65_010661 [Lagenidium giganteum]|uniref:Uncharacterized protein n=1 Tax=Lagenidium giganteum TaxID=4803 RepID=A0AAV2ZC03_9STRA|nr:TPA: hypothetical protein N0F65_010661 [Lagenidium giganteum]